MVNTNNTNSTSSTTNKVIDTSMKGLQSHSNRDKSHLDCLPPKHRAFVHHYCYDSIGNGTESVRRSGFTTTRPQETACRLLKYPKVSHAIAIEREYISSMYDLSEADILNDLGMFVKSEDIKVSDRLRAIDLLMRAKNIGRSDNVTQVAIFNDTDSLRSNILNRHKQQP